MAKKVGCLNLLGKRKDQRTSLTRQMNNLNIFVVPTILEKINDEYVAVKKVTIIVTEGKKPK